MSTKATTYSSRRLITLSMRSVVLLPSLNRCTAEILDDTAVVMSPPNTKVYTAELGRVCDVLLTPKLERMHCQAWLCAVMCCCCHPSTKTYALLGLQYALFCCRLCAILLMLTSFALCVSSLEYDVPESSHFRRVSVYLSLLIVSRPSADV